MKTKPNVGDKVFWYDGFGYRSEGIIKTIDEHGMVHFDEDNSIHWRALNGRVVTKRVANKKADCENLKRKLSSSEHFIDLLKRQLVDALSMVHKVAGLEKQLSGERYWMGCSVNNLTESTGLSWPYPTRELISKNWPYHTEVLVLQTKKSSDT